MDLFIAAKNAICTEANHSYTCLATKGTCKAPLMEVSRGTDVYPEFSEQAPMLAVARQPVSAVTKADQSSFQSYRSGVHGNRLDCKSLLDCVVFGRVTGVACARYVLGANTKAVSLAALACGDSVEGSKGDQAVLVGGGWEDMSAANTELENDGSVVLLDRSSLCGSNSTLA